MPPLIYEEMVIPSQSEIYRQMTAGRPMVEAVGGPLHTPTTKANFNAPSMQKLAKLPELCAGLWTAEAYANAIRIPYGLPTGMDEAARIALGNSILPQIPEAIGRALISCNRPNLSSAEER